MHNSTDCYIQSNNLHKITGQYCCGISFVFEIPKTSSILHLCNTTISKDDSYLKCLFLSAVCKNCASKSYGKHSVLMSIYCKSLISHITILKWALTYNNDYTNYH